MVNRDRMVSQLVLHEGFKPTPYKDTLDNVTIGIGYNVTARGWHDLEVTTGRSPVSSLSLSEARTQCYADIDRVQAAVRAHAPFFDSLSEVRQRVCVDLAFNIGFRALGFKRCIAAIEKQQWSTAAVELHKAHWAQQVEPAVDLNADAVTIHNERIRGRADRLAKMLLTGEDYAE